MTLPVAYMLSESRTTEFRHYMLWPVVGSCFDALLTIQVGKVGPRGGTSKMNITTYLVQEEITDPEHTIRPGRTFLLAKPNGSFRRVEDIVDPDDCVYELNIPPRGIVGYCTCIGYRCTGGCKHFDAMSHLVQVVGIDESFRPPVDDGGILPCVCKGENVFCEACDGTGIVNFEGVA